MSKNIKNSKNKKIFAATGMALFSLVAVFTATIAWFASNDTVDSSGITVKAMSPGITLSNIEIHRCIANQCTDNQLVFYEDHTSFSSDGTPESILTFNDYGDFVNSDPILILFNFGTEMSVKITSSTSSNTFGQRIKTNNKDNYPLSNAISFKSSTNVSLVDNKYVVTSLSSASSFVNSFPSSSNSTATKPLTQNITIYNGGSVSVAQVGVIIDYYSEAVNFLRDYRFDEGIAKVTFKCDFSMVVQEL